MKRLTYLPLILVVVATCATFDVAARQGQQAPAVAGELSSLETTDLVFSREEEKLARDTYRTLYQRWGDRLFQNISNSEQRHMDTMLSMLNLYGIDDPVTDNSTGVFSTSLLSGLYSDLVTSGEASLYAALLVGGYVEELDIRDLRLAISHAAEQPLLGAYTNLLAGSRNHLRAFVAHIRALGYDYESQLLTQEDVNEIVGDSSWVPPQNFSISPGLNDAWYYPETDGQGFVITVYPGIKTVFLVWFTYDTDLPDGNASPVVGDAGQRWLIAQGGYAGAEAELQVGSMSGGLFDSELPRPTHTAVGSILLQFDNCNAGSVTYDIPGVGQNVIPIQRVNSENVALCNQEAGK